ncbi:MAPEG family protein [Sulfitobacter sp. F26169L]|uniref:MAPEG family protein n=1 Tax=Sulfitobacter sp. F26169L TaxID=2996015 RepID=UPI002260F5AA|nr:MAPEG family protein [Sulfitobacter sp. F26169L]MCX7567243.1 MAPEG family protein [Sulfitobacter sp. F26169L]
MTPELTALTLAALLQFVQFGLYAVPANIQIGSGYLMSARDREPSRQMSVRTARLGRAFENHFEGLILFGIAVGVTQMSDQNSAFTAACAWVYLAARVLFVPAYYFGWMPGRTLIWMVGFLATLLILLAALL